jgi:hypothetical protein
MKWEQCKNLLCKGALLILCGFVLFEYGCAANANKMVPAKFEVTNKHPYTVKVQGHVAGIDSRNSLISDAALTEALAESILKSGVFKGTVQGEGADCSLSVVVLQCDRPAVGLDFNIKIETAWTLAKQGQAEIVWSGTISNTYKASLTKAYLANERLQKATEGAVRDNIQKGIEHIASLKF